MFSLLYRHAGVVAVGLIIASNFMPYGGAAGSGWVLIVLSFPFIGFFVFRHFRPPPPKAGRGDADKIAELRAAYPFVTPEAKVFRVEFSVEFSAPNGDFKRIKVRRLSPRVAEDYERAIGMIQRSAMYEAHRRGFPIRDALNEFIWPKVIQDGFVIETVENDDGSVDALVVPDIDNLHSRQEYDTADELGLVGRFTNWAGTMVSPAEERKLFDGMIPLATPALKPVRLTEPESNPNPFRPRSTEKGAAQWAWVPEMQSREATAYVREDAVDYIDPYDAPGAVLGFFAPVDWHGGTDEPVGAVFAKGEGHRVIVGPPGSGKFTAAFAPLLLTADTASAVVFDVANGEAARITAPWRSTLGPVLVIDPFGVSGQETGALNPLDFLRADDPDILQAAKRLTDALFITQPGTSNDEYWNEQAREVLTAYLLHVATDVDETDRTLRRVRELIRRPIAPEVLAAMEDNPVAGGVVRDMAANLIEAMKSDAERNTFYVTQTLRANTAFLDLPAVQTATERTSFDPRELRRRVSTLYVCLPEAQLSAVGRWLRLVYATIMEQVRERTDVPLHVLVDEFPALGKFPRVKDDMALVRKFGIHIHIATQSLTQLEGIYGAEWQSFMAAAKYQQLLGANDQMTAEYFSKRLGKTTRRTTSASQSRSTGGGSQSTSSGWEAADLMSPDELGRLHPEESVVVVEGMNPLRIRKLRYHEVGSLMARVERPDAPGPRMNFAAMPPREDREFAATRARQGEAAE